MMPDSRRSVLSLRVCIPPVKQDALAIAGRMQRYRAVTVMEMGRALAWKAKSLGLTRARRRPSLQLHQPVRRLRKDREFGKIPAYHGDFIAAMEPRTRMAVLVDFVRQVLALRDLGLVE